MLVVRSTKVTAAMLDAGRLSLIVRAGAGYNTIDVAGASTRGIYVSNCPGKNAIAVAELAFALILSLDRRVPDNVADLRAGQVEQEGVLEGAGALRQDARPARRRQHRPGDDPPRRRRSACNVVLWSRRFTGQQGPLSEQEARELGLDAALRHGRHRTGRRRPADVAERADILSVHLALGPETKGLVGRTSCSDRMKPGAMFINTARGEVVDHAALAAAVREKKLRVGLDVFANEPSSRDRGFQRSD